MRAGRRDYQTAARRRRDADAPTRTTRRAPLPRRRRPKSAPAREAARWACRCQTAERRRGCTRERAPRQSQFNLKLDVEVDRQRVVKGVDVSVRRAKSALKERVERYAVGLHVVGAVAVVEVADVEEVGRIAADRIARRELPAPRGVRTAEARVDEIGNGQVRRDLRTDVVVHLQAHVELPRLRELAKRIELAGLAI